MGARPVSFVVRAWLLPLAIVACADDAVGVGDTEGSTSAATRGTASEAGTGPGDGSGAAATSTGSPGAEATTADATGTDADATGTGTDATATDAETSTGASAACGDGLVEGDEACDDAGESATCNADCTPAACGDAQLNVAAGEACDGSALGGATCLDLGFTGGTLACTPGCALDSAGCGFLPDAPTLTLAFSRVRRFDFAWAPVDGADHYQLEESAAPGDPFVQLGGDVVGTSLSVPRPLHLRHSASYRLRACNPAGCADSAVVDVTGTLVDAVGYVKPVDIDPGDSFGYSIALSADGSTLAIGAYNEDGDGSDPSDDSLASAGAVHVFVQSPAGGWSQQAYLKASNPGSIDAFGNALSISADGNTLVVGAPNEASSAAGVDGDQASNDLPFAGAVYVFERDAAGAWSQQAYVKASNPGMLDGFGQSVAISAAGDTIAVGALEDGSSTGIGGDQASNGAVDSGAVYVFVRDGLGQWSQEAYVKASNTNPEDYFGLRVALSGGGDVLAVGAFHEDSSATGIGGNEASNAAIDAGAVYLFERDAAGAWAQAAYVKASNTDAGDGFGGAVALSGDGGTLMVGASNEDGGSAGVGGDELDDSIIAAGAVYVFERDAAGAWSQQAYVKASNPGGTDFFGLTLAAAADGQSLLVGAFLEDGDDVGVEGNQASEAALNAGAAYVFVRSGDSWAQRAYLKASNTDLGDYYGWGLAISGDGSLAAVGAYQEDGAATGIDGDPADDSASSAGAVYLY